MVDRIKKVMEFKQMSIGTFAESINVNRSSLTHIFNGRNQPSLEIAKKILNAFPDISTEWLIMGVGNMIQTAPATDSTSNPVTSIVDNMRQTELFAETSESFPEPINVQATPQADSNTYAEAAPEPEPEHEPEPEPVAGPVSKSVAARAVDVPVVPVAAPVATRTRRSSESHNSTKDTKRDRIFNSQGDKKLVKIVFFYEDRSFEEYFPS